MLYTDQKVFVYDSEIFKRHDTQRALKIHLEYTTKFSAKPPPQFFEVDRNLTHVDTLWHMPLDDRTKYTERSPLAIPSINRFQKPDWRLTKIGIVPQRRDTFILSHLSLKQFNYFPVRGDGVFWNGYRYMIINVVLDPQAYWAQTNVWLGLSVECIIPPDGDARPIPNLALPSPSEVSQSKALPQPEI